MKSPVSSNSLFGFAISSVFFATALITPASAQSTLYWGGGTTNIADGTAISTNWTSLGGIWNDTTENFSTDSSGTTYQAWSNGAIFSGTFAGYGANATTEYAEITNTADLSVSDLFLNIVKAGSTRGKWVGLNATNARTLTLLPGAVINVTGAGTNLSSDGSGTTYGLIINRNNTNLSLAGSDGFTKTGNYALQIHGNHNGLTGTVNVLLDASRFYDQAGGGNAAGNLLLGSSGNANASMAGITQFNVSAVGFAIGSANNYGTVGRLSFWDNTNNQLNDAAVVNLAGVGIFLYQGASNSTETIGSLRLGSSGILEISGNGNGGILQLTDGIVRANDRAQLSVLVSPAGTNGTVLNLGSNHGLGTNVLVPWIADATKARFGMVDASNNLAWVTPTDVTGNVSSITDINANYRIVGNSTSFGANTNFASGAAANTLAFYRSNSANPVTVRITDTLTVGGGGIAGANDGSNLEVTIEGTNGTSLTTSNNAPLYLFGGSSTAGGELRINAPITGSMDVVKAGLGTVKFGGSNQANTYTGTTYVNGGILAIGKSTGVNSIPGNAVIRSGGILQLDSSDTIANTSVVTVENGGYMNMQARSETIGGLAGGGMVASTVTTITNSLTVNSSVAPGDGGIGTLILNLGTTGGTNSFFRMNTNAVFTMELSASGLTGDRVDFYNYNIGEFVLVSSNKIDLTLVGDKTPGTYTNTIFQFFSDAGTTLTNSTINSGLTIGTWSADDFASAPTISYNGFNIDLAYEVVPEPSTIALLGLSGLALAAYGLRRRNR